MDRIEALSDAIAKYSDYAEVGSRAYAARNPGSLKDKHGRVRIFKSLVAGYAALRFDLKVKCDGRSNSGLKHESGLNELLYTLGFRDETVRYVVSYLRRVLDNPTIKAETPVEYFVEE